MSASVFKINEHVLPTDNLAMIATVPTGYIYRLMSVTTQISAAPTTAEDFTINLDANAGAVYDVRLYTLDPSAASTTDIVWYPDGWELLLQGGDAITVDYNNTDGNTIGVQVTFKRIPS